MPKAGRELAEGKDQPDAETGGEEHSTTASIRRQPGAGLMPAALGSIGAAHRKADPVSVEWIEEIAYD